MKIDLFQNILNKQFDFDKVVEEFSIIESFKNVSQNPKYHGEGNVYIHTKNTCSQLINLNEWQELDNKQKVILYISALFHDIGKLSCTKIENGEIISPKHAVRGAKAFREICYKEYQKKFNISFETREQIVIDWMTATKGNPLADIARTSIMLKFADIPSQVWIVRKIINFARNKLYLEYLNHYIKISGTDINKIEAWELPVAAARLIEWLPESEKIILINFINMKMEELK